MQENFSAVNKVGSTGKERFYLLFQMSNWRGICDVHSLFCPYTSSLGFGCNTPESQKKSMLYNIFFNNPHNHTGNGSTLTQVKDKCHTSMPLCLSTKYMLHIQHQFNRCTQYYQFHKFCNATMGQNSRRWAQLQVWDSETWTARW